MTHTSPNKIAVIEAIRDAIPGTSTAAQCQRVRAILAKDSATTFELMRYGDIYDPRARVMQLRAQGERIDTHWQTIVTESGDKHRVGLYVLGATHA